MAEEKLPAQFSLRLFATGRSEMRISMNIEKRLFGTEENKSVYMYIVTGENVKAVFLETGAAVQRLEIKDKSGKFTDVVLGLEKYEHYKKNWPGFGAVIGRCANRISRARFSLDGKKYKLMKNCPGGCLHSGFSFQYRNFESKAFVDETGAHIIFTMDSPDGDQGFPGNLKFSVEYILEEKRCLTISYKYISDKDTPVNVTNHSYFNLNGHASGSAMEHRVQIFADSVTKADKNLMPTGEIVHVAGSAFDFREMTRVCDNVTKDFCCAYKGKEYDVNYVLSMEKGELKHAVKVEADNSALGMNVYTDMPGMQFYTANAIEKFRGKDNAVYVKNPALCFETQFFPDAVNIESFPSPVIKAGEENGSITKFEFYDK